MSTTSSTSLGTPPVPIRQMMARNPRTTRAAFDRGFAVVCVFAAAFSVFALAVLLARIIWSGVNYLSWTFITGMAGSEAATSGIGYATVGTVCICIVCALTAIPIGIGTAVLLEEYRPRNEKARRVHDFVQLNITNLAGVPSVVYGLLGLTVFVYMFNLFGSVSNPGFEFGATHYDRFLTLGGKTVLAPVADHNSPDLKPSEVPQFYTDTEQPVAVEVASSEDLQPKLDEIDSRSADLTITLEAATKSGTLTTVDQIRKAVDDAWKAAGHANAIPVESADKIVASVKLAMDSTGRKARKALEAVSEEFARVEVREVFPNTILSNSVPQEEVKRAPWYLRIPFGRSVLTGGLTLMLVVLPIIIISTQEALRSVSRSLRQASLAMGATQWQTISKVTLPAAIPGIMTGIILAMSRAIGEAAPVLMVASGVFVPYLPQNLMDGFTAMPLQIYTWVGKPQEEFRQIAAAGIILLLGILLCFNGLAIYIRQRTQRMA